MKTINKILKVNLIAIIMSIGLGALNSFAFAQESQLNYFEEKYTKENDKEILKDDKRPKREERKTPGIRNEFFRDYLKATEHSQMDPPQYDEALEILLDQDFTDILNPKTKKRHTLNSYESAAFYNSIATIYLSQQKYQQALKYYKLILQLDKLNQPIQQGKIAPTAFEQVSSSSGSEIPYELLDGVNFLIGQIYFTIEEYENALPYLNQWYIQQAFPPSHNLIFIANAYYYAGSVEGLNQEQANKYNRSAISFIYHAIQNEEAIVKPAKENWYVFLRMLHNNFEEYDVVLEIAELLVSRWPKKKYWTQLSGLYARKSSEEGLSEAEILNYEERQLVALEIAYRQGMLTQARELESISQLFLYHEIPYKSSKTLSMSMDQGISKNSYKNYNLLSMAYLKGKDIEKSIEPLSKAAELAEDGELYMRLANVYLQLDKYDEGAEAIDKGLAKGGIKRPDIASFLQGQAYMYMERFDDARIAFREAATDERVRKNANTWLKYIDGEEKRIKDIKAYLN